MLILSVTCFWRKEKLDEFWSELPQVEYEDS